MGILADWQIEAEVSIAPFEKYDREIQAGKISFGLSSYGYDARVGYVFDIFKPYPGLPIDPKNFSKENLERVDLTPKPTGQVGCKNCSAFDRCPKHAIPDHILIPPNSFALAETVETFVIPRDIQVVVVGKSTYARCGLIVNVTPLEPEWRGKVTVELSNTTPLPMKVYAGEGIMQLLFLRADGPPCRVSYADKKGKYMGDQGLTLPKVINPADQELVRTELKKANGLAKLQQACNKAAAEVVASQGRSRLADDGGVHDYGADVPPEAETGVRNTVIPDLDVISETEIELDNDDPDVPDSVLAAIHTRLKTQAPPPAARPITSHDRMFQRPAPPEIVPDPNGPPIPVPPDYLAGRKVFVAGDGSTWRYNQDKHAWVMGSGPATKR